MSLSSIFVVTNALRLRWFKPDFNITPTRSVTGNSATTEVPEDVAVKNINPETIIINEKVSAKLEGETKMEKTILIEGMTCDHCRKRVEDALNALDGVDAKVDLQEKKAFLKLDQAISETSLTGAVTEAGYTVVKIM